MTDLRGMQQYIDGEWTDAVSGRTYVSENPFAQEAWAEVPDSDEADVDRAVAAATRAFNGGPWSELIPQERARLIRRLADLCHERAADLAILESTDNGKLVSEHTFQWLLISELFHYWAGQADKINGEVVDSPIPIPVKGLPLPEAFAYTRREPIGVVACVMPWNSPGLLLASKLGPALAAGCPVVAKPSEHTPVSTLELARLIEEAGFPAGAFNVVTSQNRSAGEALVAHRDVAKIAFTGSTATGTAIAKSAAASLTPVTCELGGKSATIVFADADFEQAVHGAAAAIFGASGQTCQAGSRILVEDSLHDRFTEALAAEARSMKMGDPLDWETQLGPLSNRQNYEKVLGYLELGRQEGAKLVCGGAPAERGGYFVEPTIFTEVSNDMRIAREEIFGPVACVLRFGSEDEAVALANDTDYGLAGSVFTQNVARAHRVAHRVRAGTMYVNTTRLMSHLVPFGGYKSSGLGREGGAEGLGAYLETKAVWVVTG